MNRILSPIALIALLFTSACGAEKLPDPSAVESKSVLSELRDMRRAYERKDRGAVMTEVSDSYKDRQDLSTALSAIFSKYETVRLNIQYTKMVITIEEKGIARATFNWDGEWTAHGGNAQKDGGRVTMIFEAGSLKLLAIDGKNPFVPQPGETPGKQ